MGDSRALSSVELIARDCQPVFPYQTTYMISPDHSHSSLRFIPAWELTLSTALLVHLLAQPHEQTSTGAPLLCWNPNRGNSFLVGKRNRGNVFFIGQNGYRASHGVLPLPPKLTLQGVLLA